MLWRAVHSKSVDKCHSRFFPARVKRSVRKVLSLHNQPSTFPPSQLWPLVASFSSPVAIRSNTPDGFSLPLFPPPRSPVPPISSRLLWRRLIALATSQLLFDAAEVVVPLALFCTYS